MCVYGQYIYIDISHIYLANNIPSINGDHYVPTRKVCGSQLRIIHFVSLSLLAFHKASLKT